MKNSGEANNKIIFKNQVRLPLSLSNQPQWLIKEGNETGTLLVVSYSDGALRASTEFRLTPKGWMPTNEIKSLSQDHAIYQNFRIDLLLIPSIDIQTELSYYQNYTYSNLHKSLKPELTSTIIERPKKIFLSQSLHDEPVAVATEEVEKKLGIIWTEKNLINEYHLDELKSIFNQDETNTDLPKIIKQLKECQPKLCIRFMNEKAGYGVFAHEDIPEDVFFTTYSGQLLPRSQFCTDEYIRRDTSYCICAKQTTNDIYSTQGFVDSIKYRNMGALVQHIPKCSSDKDKHKHATENVTRVDILFEGFPVILFKTARAIKKGEILGWDYGKIYWDYFGCIPQLFTKTGQTIMSEDS